MKNIEKWLYSTLADDATLRALLGGSATDPRVYFHFPPVESKDKIGTSEGVISFYLTSSGSLSGDVVWAVAKPDEVYSVDVFCRSKSAIEDMFERIDALLDENLQASITGWKVRRIHRVAQLDIFEPEDRINHKHLEYEFTGIWNSS